VVVNQHELWALEQVRAVADVLGHTDTGLTGKEIGELLTEVKARDLYPAITKRDRLREGLLECQARTGLGNCVVAFVNKAMSPVRYRDKPGLFTLRQDALNEVLIYGGLYVNDEGKLARGARASTLDEASRHANTLRTELRRRGTHQAVLDYCTTELLSKNAFHASLEATKGVAHRLRRMTGLDGDGAKIVDAAFALGQTGTPMLAINSLATHSERDEQTGFANIVKGIFGMFRNPVAHDPRAVRTVTDDELLALLTTLSMVHRRLDKAHHI
jgi:uncharacterized protein (TIGR02391 family)